MTQNTYLLHIQNHAAGDVVLETIHHIDAASLQHVKYWYHAVQKSCGFHDISAYESKHALQGPNGLVTELDHIQELSYAEAPVAKNLLPRWPTEMAEDQ